MPGVMRILYFPLLFALATAQDHRCQCGLLFDIYDIEVDFFNAKFEDIGSHDATSCGEEALAVCKSQCRSDAEAFHAAQQTFNAVYPGSDPPVTYGQTFCSRIKAAGADTYWRGPYPLAAEYKISGETCPRSVVWNYVGMDVMWNLCCDVSGNHVPCGNKKRSDLLTY